MVIMKDETLPGADVEAHIRAAYDSMSSGQRKVAEFILTRGVEAIYLPAARIAALAQVSHSTVVRTAQALGFEGFPDLQASLQEQHLARVGAVERLQFGPEQLSAGPAWDGSGKSSTAFGQIMMADAAHIAQVAQQVPVADFEQAVDMLDSARRVYIIGLRGSAGLAQNFGLGLQQVRADCFILRPSIGDLADQLMGISDDDLLVAISYGRFFLRPSLNGEQELDEQLDTTPYINYSRETICCMDYSRESGARILAVTDHILSPAAKRADVALVVPIYIWFYMMSAAPFSLLSALLVALAMRHEDQARDRLEQRRAVIRRHFRFFEGDEESGSTRK